jgi:hypothetical protein
MTVKPKAAQPPLVGAEAVLLVTPDLIRARASRGIAGRRYRFPPVRIAQDLK